MKKSIILTAAAALMMTACDVIEPNDRLTPTDEYPQSNRVVLVEEYTGHMCPNCPTGAEVVKSMVELSGHKVIPVSVHCGNFAIVAPAFPQDFNTEAGKEYFETFKPEAFPSIQINRSGQINENYDTWISALIEQAWQQSPAEISISRNYNATTREVEITTTVTGLQDIVGDVSLQLWMLESGIVGRQITPQGIKDDYEHNHVLRDAINGIWGESIGTFESGEEKTIKHTYKLAGDDWVADNCTIVAFIFDSATKGNVIQAAEIELTNK